MTVMNTEETIGKLCGLQPELYISTGSHYLPPGQMKDPCYLLPVHWPYPRIVTRDRVVLAVSLSLDDKWYFTGEWQLSDDWEALCTRPLYSHDAAPYLIPLKQWYAEVERRELSGGRTITPWSGLIHRRRLYLRSAPQRYSVFKSPLKGEENQSHSLTTACGERQMEEWLPSAGH